MSRHRATGRASYDSYPDTFIPTHCTGRPSSGGSCLHPHPGEPAWDPFPGLDEPVQRCDRSAAHGAHDITNEAGDFRCPGKALAALPAPRLKERVEQVRAAVGGAR